MIFDNYLNFRIKNWNLTQKFGLFTYFYADKDYYSLGEDGNGCNFYEIFVSSCSNSNSHNWHFKVYYSSFSNFKFLILISHESES